MRDLSVASLIQVATFSIYSLLTAAFAMSSPTDKDAAAEAAAAPPCAPAAELPHTQEETASASFVLVAN